MHLIDMDTLLILLSLRPGYHHPKGQYITIHPVRRPTSSSVNPNPETSPFIHVCVSSVVIYHAICPLQAHMRHAPYTRTPYPTHARETSRVAFDTTCNTPSTPRPAILTPGSSLRSYIVPTDQPGSFALCPHSYALEKTSRSVTHAKLLQVKHA
jgi:hypothetical protein